MGSWGRPRPGHAGTWGRGTGRAPAAFADPPAPGTAAVSHRDGAAVDGAPGYASMVRTGFPSIEPTLGVDRDGRLFVVGVDGIDDSGMVSRAVAWPDDGATFTDVSPASPGSGGPHLRPVPPRRHRHRAGVPGRPHRAELFDHHVDRRRRRVVGHRRGVRPDRPPEPAHRAAGHLDPVRLPEHGVLLRDRHRTRRGTGRRQRSLDGGRTF